ncbi:MULTISPECIES: LexA family transcriptional regulator [unclassified Streptococcus]|uniref:LexA family transcriptional regulator n=1 Tax=unclassified Streptococcus TaxID=2608887 RepID=UPI00211B48EC|nr:MULTISPECIES: LexA family transcriptional regulator [unclassified Streptococcus]MCQ9211624.1 LexA family transcriptional regulator [Streptococcus sp. B01]MCQ9213143.1 LexA family transcriptional regulator [Streptococcus sp. O1]
MARGRGKLTPQDKLDMQEFSRRLNNLLSERNCTQAELARQTKIPPSTLTGYVKGTSLPVPGNVQKIADFFGLLKSDIDPRFSSSIKPITSSPDAKNDTIKAINEKVVQLHSERQENVLEYATEQLNEQKKATTEIQEEPVAYNSDKIIAFSRKDNDFESLIVHGLESAGDGIWQENDVDIEVRIPKDEIPDEFDDLAMVIGDSMRPKLHNGDILFVTFTKQIEIGQIGVFRTSKGNFVKKLQPDRLESLNPNYDDIYFNEDEFAEAIGVVEDIYRK